MNQLEANRRAQAALEREYLINLLNGRAREWADQMTVAKRRSPVVVSMMCSVSI